MTKNHLIFLFTVIVIIGFFQFNKTKLVPTPEALSIVDEEIIASENEWTGPVTERYTARVDRVEVVFEHQEYTRYRLKTNDLVRTGALNTERGFKDDINATIYVLNWQQPEGEQLRYVRLSAEPTHLYTLDTNQEIIAGSKLTLNPN